MRSKQLKDSYVNFIRELPWHWFITIPTDMFDSDDELIRQLRRVEAHFCKTFQKGRYNELDDDARYISLIAFEGDAAAGNRHAHLLIYVPPPTQSNTPHDMIISRFPDRFRIAFLLLLSEAIKDKLYNLPDHGLSMIWFGPANEARKVYAVKLFRGDETAWSRVEFVTPPKFSKFKNHNLVAAQNRNKQKRISLGLAQLRPQIRTFA